MVGLQQLMERLEAGSVNREEVVQVLERLLADMTAKLEETEEKVA